MGKSSKKSATKKVATAKVIRNVRNEADSKNLQFLLDPKQSQVLTSRNKRTVNSEEKRNTDNRKNETTATVSCPNRPTVRSIQEKNAKPIARASPAKRCAIPVPLIDMDPDDNNHQLDMKTKLLRDWISNSDDDYEDLEIDLQADDAKLNEYDSLSGYVSFPNDIKTRSTDEANTGINESFRHGNPTDRTLQSDSGAAVDQDPVHALSDVRKHFPTRKTYARSSPSSVIPQSDRAATFFEEVTAMNPFSSSPAPIIDSACICGKQSKIDDLTEQNKMLVIQNKKLTRLNKESNIRCLALMDSLNAKVLGMPQDAIFTEMESFPDKEKLRKFSEAAGSRDYIFVKLLLLEISPDGLQNMTVTGRASNNPNGRKGERFHGNEYSEKIGLDPVKVEYIEARFVEHRRYQGDSSAVAANKMKGCRGLMARVISYYGNK